MDTCTTLKGWRKGGAWAAQITAAVILAQTLFFKFTAAPESVYIFTTLGLEPWGRIGSGLVELVACVLLLRAQTAAFGAALSIALMAGALQAHFGRLGIEVQGDGGLLFGLACTVALAAATVLALRRRQIPIFGRRFA